MAEINKNMTILEIVQKHPESREILLESGLHCLGCALAGQETLEQGLQAHGIADKKIDEIVKKINGKIKDKQPK